MKKFLGLALVLLPLALATPASAALVYERTPAGVDPYSPISLHLEVDDIYDPTQACGTLGEETVTSWTVAMEEVDFTGVIYGPGGLLDMGSTPSSYGVSAGTLNTTFVIDDAPVGFEPYAIQAYCYWSESGWSYGHVYEYNDDNPIFTIAEAPIEISATEFETLTTAVTLGFASIVFLMVFFFFFEMAH